MIEDYEYFEFDKLDESNNGWIRGRIHTIRHKGNMCFIVLRDGLHSIQAIANKKNLKQLDESDSSLNSFKELTKLTNETVVDLFGKIRPTPFPVKFTSYSNIEFDIERWVPVSRAEQIPFQIDDANDYGESFRSDVEQVTKLDSRWLDLRAPVNNAVFKIQSGITNMFREYMVKNGFTEIHTPKTIGNASEGGAEVFRMDYYGKPACLAQSPQLYKQIAINSDFKKVFEVGPVFRAENCISRRHLSEFTGLDFEMVLNPTDSYPNSSYMQIMGFMWGMLKYIFSGIEDRYQNELKIIREKLPSLPPVVPDEPLIIKFEDAVQMLKEDGKQQDPFEDLNTENERRLGEIVKEKYGSDLFVVDEYPLNARPFYTMPHPNKKGYSCSYDMIFRCQEICSGAQRVNDYNMLISRVKECGVNPESLSFYIDSFKYGSYPHGGAGFGLERILSFYLELGNIRRASFCPRDPKRITP